MKKILQREICICLTLLLFFANASFISRESSLCTIHVTVKSLRNNSGKVLLTLYSSAEGFPDKPEKAYQKTFASIVNKTAIFSLEGIPYGTYAIAVFHDENANNALETNFMGIPKEGLGASRDAKGSMGPPKFEDAKFQVNSTVSNQTITMGYIF